MHWDWHETAPNLFVAQNLKAVKGFSVVYVVGAALLTASGTNGAFGLLQAPFSKQCLAQTQDAVTVSAITIVEFFQSDLHALGRACSLRELLYARKAALCPRVTGQNVTRNKKIQNENRDPKIVGPRPDARSREWCARGA